MYLGSEISGEVIETGEGVKQLSKVNTYIHCTSSFSVVQGKYPFNLYRSTQKNVKFILLWVSKS